MKLLLTSSGLENKSLEKALEKLLGHKLAGTKAVDIPTAANVEPGEKSWLIDGLVELRDKGFDVDIIDPTPLPHDEWLERVQQAELIWMGGGNSAYLAWALQQCGFGEEIRELLKTRVYVGSSAGSCVASRSMSNPVQDLFDETWRDTNAPGLGLVDFQIIPHLNNFPGITLERIAPAAAEMTETIYALDDDSAVMVDGDEIKVASEGVWKRFN